jgi:hypothetical protein
MTSPRLLATLLIALLAASVSAQDAANKREGEPKLKIEKVELDKTKISLPCPPGQRPRSDSCDDSTVITAKVITRKRMPKNAELNTTVSGGRIASQKGTEFQWDLRDVYPGTYTFTVAATYGNGRWGESVTQAVEVIRCPDCGYVDFCHVLTMDEVKPVEAGELMEFTVKVSGDPGDSVTYNWTVSAGTIESGQGTKSIKVRTDENMEGQSVTATVEIGNLPPGPSCQNTASETAAVTAKKPKEN